MVLVIVVALSAFAAPSQALPTNCQSCGTVLVLINGWAYQLPVCVEGGLNSYTECRITPQGCVLSGDFCFLA